MTTKKNINDFLALRKIAVVGVSNNSKKFGTICYHFLKDNGYEVVPVNAKLNLFDDQKCYPDLKSIPQKIDGALLVIPPAETEKVVVEAREINLKNIWMQTGAQSIKAIKFCEENDINVIHNECILMFAEPVKGFHKFHRTVNKIFGKLPA